MLALPVPAVQSANGHCDEKAGRTARPRSDTAKRLAVGGAPGFTAGAATHSNNGAVPLGTPPLKPLGLMQMLAPLLAVLLAVVVALLAAWALSLPAPAPQGVTAIQPDRHMLYGMGNSGFCPGC
jgi:hypothetical protein